MSTPIEITIPSGAPEVVLKTAGKYCDKDIVVKNSFRMESGLVTLSDETHTFSIPDIKQNVKYVEVVLEGVPTGHTSSYPIRFALYDTMRSKMVEQCKAEDSSLEQSISFAPAGIGYYLPATASRVANVAINSVRSERNENGLSIYIEGGDTEFFSFPAGNYTYTAYYWD